MSMFQNIRRSFSGVSRDGPVASGRATLRLGVTADPPSAVEGGRLSQLVEAKKQHEMALSRRRGPRVFVSKIVAMLTGTSKRPHRGLKKDDLKQVRDIFGAERARSPVKAKPEPGGSSTPPRQEDDDMKSSEAIGFAAEKGAKGDVKTKFLKMAAWLKTFALGMWAASWVINPTTRFSRMWSVTQGALVIYVSLKLPFYFAFAVGDDEIVDPGASGTPAAEWNYLDYCIDVFFAMDMFFRFHTGYITESGKLVMNRSAIQRSYLKTWFSIDAIAVFPWEFVVSDGNQGKLSRKGMKLSKMIKISRLLRVHHVLRRLQVRRSCAEHVSFFLFSVTSTVI